MDEASPSPDDALDLDERFAERFKTLCRGRSIGRLREDMAKAGYPIGANAIQAARRGSRGLRLETLQKFADYFEVPLAELIDDVSDAERAEVKARRDSAAHSRRFSLEQALDLLAGNLQEMKDEKRKLILDAIAIYASNPSAETAARDLVVNTLAPKGNSAGGESPPVREADPKTKAA